MSSGRITPTDVLTACDSAGMAHEPVTASEVAEELGCTRRAALNKLDELAERGDINSKKVGARSRVWWPSDALNESFTDDTERNQVKTELEEVFGRISEAFYALNEEWRFTYVSEHAEELLDFQADSLVGKNFWEVFEWATDSKLREEYCTAMETQEPTSFEFYYPEPLDAWYEVNAYPSETGLSVYFRDVTDRKQRERELEESERRYRALVEHFPNGAVGLVDTDLRYQTVGGDPTNVVDITADEIEGKPVREAIPTAVADELAPRYEAALDGESDAFEAEFDDRIFEFQVVPVRDNKGDVFAALGMSWDITDRKETRRKLVESEHRYRTLAENFPDGAVGLFDEDLEYTAIGGQLLSQVGVTPQERIGKSVSEVYPDDIVNEAAPYFQAALDGKAKSFELEFHGRHLYNHTLPVRDADGDVSAGMLVVQDITDRKETEQELRASEAKFRTLAENLDEIVWMSDPDTREFLYVNPAYEDVWGRDRETLYEEPLSFLEATHPEDRERVSEAYESVPDEGFDIKYRIIRPDGEVRWLHAQASRVRDEDGEVYRIVGIADDVTEQVERERKLRESNERLESFASMLAHELRNPLNIGQIYSQQLPNETDSDAVEYVTEAFDRIEDMIDVMLVLTRGREAVGERTSVQLADVVQDVWDEMDTFDATLEGDIDHVIQVDETYIRHLFWNLFENAVEHGGRDVTITVGELPTGFYVADDGPGIPVDERDAVFEAGFTTAAQQGGTGLGLAFVQKLAEVYEWDCMVTESAAGGARFEFANVDQDAQGN